MAIMRVIRAREGDTLCSIAYEDGFKNCTKLRPENSHLSTRPVQEGDRVNVPEVTRKDESGQTEMTHRFVRPGGPNRVWIIQDNNRPTGHEMLRDRQAQLAISNYVTGRQGTGQATNVWRDHTYRQHDVDASTDLDHFKLLVYDRRAKDRSETEVQADLKTQKPIMGAVLNEIARWEDVSEPGTNLNNVVCEQIAPDSPWYRSCYLRLVVYARDQNGRLTDGTDPPDDRSQQTLVVPYVKDASGNPDKELEILDQRVEGYRPEPDCESGGPTDPQHCRARVLADVGKNETILKVKIVRIGGAAGSNSTDAQVRMMTYANLRTTMAQANVGVFAVREPDPGVTIVDDYIHDVDPPRNLIAVSDYDGLAATGGSVELAVQLSAGRVPAAGELTVNTVAGESPEQTAQRIASALRAENVACTVSQNPARTDDTTRRSCDVLCNNTDGTMARIITARNMGGESQAVTHTGGWNNNAVQLGHTAYPGPTQNELHVRMVGCPDQRAATKNFNLSDALVVFLVAGFADPLLNGIALIPYTGVGVGATGGLIRPLRSFQFALFLDVSGVVPITTLAHESGHIFLNAYHTSNTNGGETDFAGNAYPTNPILGLSEWMATIGREPNHIHTRISDEPLAVQYFVVLRGVNHVAGVIETLQGRNNSPSARYRSLYSSFFQGPRRLRPEPRAPL